MFSEFIFQKLGSDHTSVLSGSQERKLQRRSVRSRSESERGSDPVPKKKTKKEQVSVIVDVILDIIPVLNLKLDNNISMMI